MHIFIVKVIFLIVIISSIFCNATEYPEFGTVFKL